MHSWTWFQMISGRVTETNIHVVSAAFVLILLTIFSIIIRIGYRNPESKIVPSAKGGLGNIFEVIVEFVMGLIRQVVGDQAPKYFPLIGTLFVYIFTCNMLGILPGFLPPTDNINTNLACSLTVFVYYNIMGIKAHGLKNYMKHFMGPILWLGPLMFVIELIGHLVRPVSLSLRLFGNITGDHLVISIFQGLVPYFIPIAFLALGVFVSFIQAFVYSLLTTIYIALATEHGEEHGGESHHQSFAHASEDLASPVLVRGLSGGRSAPAEGGSASGGSESFPLTPISEHVYPHAAPAGSKL